MEASSSNHAIEHTLLVTETGVEVLTARLPNSPGGAISWPVIETNGSQSSEQKPAP